MNWVERVQKLGGIVVAENMAHPHCREEQACLFRTFEGGGTEIETLWLLWALVRRAKPELVLETGAFHGIGTVALASALKENAGGKLMSLEVNRDQATKACNVVEAAGLADFVEVLNQDSLAFIKELDTTRTKFDFAFLDSANDI